ncbi:type IX secretion system motor protein PorM/GldM [Cesiribacter andamanensis]|uniref:Gliding motility-associated protein GldM n=1 Tax=Cesiribacter andamanensis AMV16 TaxID=1279009 RepID=M7N599_9BACT|nr:gliding motility protein GldM [Cesiribacter andamanensis]EMR03783.1 gliding motility-associated protein GldM [Cesiribacter andamanensis AMV16]
MAGGKETPRQKMIGMMYLVLTALLALQVSNTVLEKFIFINRSLEHTVSETNTGNSNLVSRIQKQVDESGNRKDDAAVLQTAREVRERTQQIIAELNQIKADLVQQTGGFGEDGVTPVNINDEEVLANLMINKKKGEELKAQLNDYAAFLQQKSGVKTDPIAYDGAEHPIFANDPNQKSKNFAELNFGQTPLVAGLATITQYETEVLMREQAALDELARKVGAEDVKFDRVVPMVLPNARVVAAGTKYTADMFIAASSSSITPDMYVNGKKLPVGPDGFGKVEFPASASSYDADGLAKQTYKAEIRVTLPGGRDTTYTNTIEYFVAKPVIQVQSASVQALYLQCGNELNVQVPALGTAYQPNFTADGASVLQGNKPGIVTLVPNAKNVKLNVSSGGTFIGSENFGVRLVPKPDIIPTDGGRELDQKQGIKAAQLGRIVMRADADASFKEFLPKDARFRVTGYTVYLARGNRPVANQKVNGPEVNLRQWAAQARPGDRIVIEVTEVKRMNFRDEVLDVPMGTKTFTLPINE